MTFTTATYEEVNAAWPKEIPSITATEARRAAQKLALHFGGRLRRTPRRCWIAITPPFDSLDRGWRRLVHDAAHIIFKQQNRNTYRSHGGWHAGLELEMTQYVIAQGWLSGSLKKKDRPKEQNGPAEKLARIIFRISHWERKEKLAKTKLKKYRKLQRYYERKSTAVMA